MRGHIPCVCCVKNPNGQPKAIPVRYSRFVWLEDWGVFTWLMAGLLALFTSGLWVCCILGWHFRDLIHPAILCGICGRRLEPEEIHSAML